jgi:hypothetical protein
LAIEFCLYLRPTILTFLLLIYRTRGIVYVLIYVSHFHFGCSVDLKSLVEQNKPNFVTPSSRMTNYVVLKFGNLGDSKVCLSWAILVLPPLYTHLLPCFRYFILFYYKHAIWVVIYPLIWGASYIAILCLLFLYPQWYISKDVCISGIIHNHILTVETHKFIQSMCFLLILLRGKRDNGEV